MLWGHTNCPIVEGWQSRLRTKFAMAGVGGTFAGAVLAVLQQQPFLRHCLGTTASCMLCVGGFAVCQETCRLMRCEDSAANSAIAGAATAALLLNLQSKKQAALPGAIVTGLAAAAIYALDDRLQPVTMAQQWLVDNDLMDRAVLGQQQIDQTMPKHKDPGAPTDITTDSSGQTWGEFFGIKALTDEQWQEHEQQRKAKFDRRLAKAGLGPEDQMERMDRKTRGRHVS